LFFGWANSRIGNDSGFHNSLYFHYFFNYASEAKPSDEDKSSSLSALAIARLMSDEDKSSSLSALAIARLMSEAWRRNFMFLL